MFSSASPAHDVFSGHDKLGIRAQISRVLVSLLSCVYNVLVIGVKRATTMIRRLQHLRCFTSFIFFRAKILSLNSLSNSCLHAFFQIIIPPGRVFRGRPQRNVEEQKVPNASEVQPYGEVTNMEFWEAIWMLSQVVTNKVEQHKGYQKEGADTSRVHEFLKMNSSSFTGSSTTEDPKNIVEELKVFEVMHALDSERVNLDSYQLKVVART